MLAVYAYWTNCGINSVASAESHGEDEIRYVRRRYLTPEAARTVAVAIADATFAARDRGLWGEGSTSVASDSTHFRSWDQNLFTLVFSRGRWPFACCCITALADGFRNGSPIVWLSWRMWSDERSEEICAGVLSEDAVWRAVLDGAG